MDSEETPTLLTGVAGAGAALAREDLALSTEEKQARAVFQTAQGRGRAQTQGNKRARPIGGQQGKKTKVCSELR